MAAAPRAVCHLYMVWIYLASTGQTAIPELRLSGGGSSCAGRVEVLQDGSWGSVCDDDWDALDAEVTCKHLNCGSALAAYRGSYFGSGPSNIHIHEVQCNGTEKLLWECQSYRRHQDCTWAEHAGVLCTGHREVRLTGGPHNCSGRVEVFIDGVWMTVCDAHWFPADSAMLCANIGCGPFLKQMKHQHTLGNYVTFFCSDQTSLWNCSVKKKAHFCFQADALGITCQGLFQEEAFTSTNLTTTDTRASLPSPVTARPLPSDGISWTFLIPCILLAALLFIVIFIFSAVIWRLRKSQKSWQKNSSQVINKEERYFRISSLKPTQMPEDSLQIPILYTGSIPRSPNTRARSPVPAAIPHLPPISAELDDEEDYDSTGTPPKLLATFQDSLRSHPEVTADPPATATAYCNFERSQIHTPVGPQESSSTSSGEQNWYQNYRYQLEGQQDLVPPPQSYDGSSDYDDVSSDASD